MAAVVSTPILAYISALLSGAGVAQSSSLTVTFSCGGWEIQVPVRVAFTTVSADPVVSIYASSDATGTYDTVAFAGFSITRVTSGQARASIRLPIGYYVMQLLNSGPNTATFFVDTCQVLTAIQNL